MLEPYSLTNILQFATSELAARPNIPSGRLIPELSNQISTPHIPCKGQPVNDRCSVGYPSRKGRAIKFVCCIKGLTQ